MARRDAGEYRSLARVVGNVTMVTQLSMPRSCGVLFSLSRERSREGLSHSGPFLSHSRPCGR
jgi:hypothetical protein